MATVSVAPSKADLNHPRALVVGLACAPFLPLLLWHFSFLWARPHYQFFPFVILGATLLLRRGLHAAGPVQPGACWLSLVVLGVAAGLTLMAGLLFSPWLGAVAVLVQVVGVLHALGGWRLLAACVPAVFFLGLMLPVPFDLDLALLARLQRSTSLWSSALLDYIGVFHVLSGNVLDVPGKTLFVDDACSGIHSLFAAGACTFFFLLWARRPILHGVLLLASCVGSVLIINVVRVATIVYFQARHDVDLSEGWRHELLGLTLFAACLGFLVSMDRLLMFLSFGHGLSLRKGICGVVWVATRFTSKEKRKRAGVQSVQPSAVQSPATPEQVAAASSTLPPLEATVLARPGLLRSWAVLTAALVILCWPWAGSTAATSDRFDRLQGLAAADLPSEVDGWKQADFTVHTRGNANIFGEHSKCWHWRRGMLAACLSVDFPFPDWHDLRVCYRGLGWTVKETNLLSGATVGPPDAKPQAAITEIHLEKPLRQHGYLLFASRSLDGAYATSPSTPAALLERFGQRLTQGPGVWKGSGTTPHFQVQLLVESIGPLTPAEARKARELFTQLEETLSRKIVPSSGPQEGER